MWNGVDFFESDVASMLISTVWNCHGGWYRNRFEDTTKIKKYKSSSNLQVLRKKTV